MYRNLFRDRDGVAAIEFALIVPVLLTMIGGMTDFPLAFGDQIQIATGVAAGAAYAFNQTQNVSGTTPTVSSGDVQIKVLSAINLPNVSVAVSRPSLDCISTSTSTPPAATLTLAAAGSTCPNGNPPGTYMVIAASYVYTPIMPLYSTLASLTLIKSAVVRLY
jgi:Flp pilus assembly protein TadG